MSQQTRSRARRRRIHRRLAVASLSFFVLACEEGVVYPGGEIVAGFFILPSSVRVSVTGVFQLLANARNGAGITLPIDDVVWSSRDTLVASIDALGLLTAHAEGETVISATLGSDVATVSLTVDPPPAASWAEHVCAWASGGSVYCWGRGVSGELGGGDRNGSLVPRLVPFQGVLRSVTTGAGHSCGVMDSGDTWCWGRGAEGQLGGGTILSSLSPQFIAGAAFHFLKVAAGGRHTCGLTVESRIRCWGWNNDGQLGNATTVGLRDPVLIESGLRFKDVSAGARHTCAVAEDGLMWCWGANDRGQLGDATTTDSQRPVRVATGDRFLSVSAGADHTCALDEGQLAQCWGANTSAQLGRGHLEDRSHPTPLSFGFRYESISAGLYHTCALRAGGQLYCWGEGSAGQLGIGDSVLHGNPQLIGDKTYQSVFAGSSFSCAVERVSLRAYCWGTGSFGQLGQGLVRSVNVPSIVSSEVQFRQIGR